MGSRMGKDCAENKEDTYAFRISTAASRAFSTAARMGGGSMPMDSASLARSIVVIW